MHDCCNSSYKCQCFKQDLIRCGWGGYYSFKGEPLRAYIVLPFWDTSVSKFMDCSALHFVDKAFMIHLATRATNPGYEVTRCWWLLLVTVHKILLHGIFLSLCIQLVNCTISTTLLNIIYNFNPLPTPSQWCNWLLPRSCVIATAAHAAVNPGFITVGDHLATNFIVHRTSNFTFLVF